MINRILCAPENAMELFESDSILPDLCYIRCRRLPVCKLIKPRGKGIGLKILADLSAVFDVIAIFIEGLAERWPRARPVIRQGSNGL